jgi:hypothetical protein
MGSQMIQTKVRMGINDFHPHCDSEILKVYDLAPYPHIENDPESDHIGNDGGTAVAE